MGKFFVQKMALSLVIIGALNWGLTAFDMNLVKMFKNYLDNLLGSQTNIDKMIYIIIALASFKLMKRDVQLPFLGKTVIPSAVIPLKKNKFQNDTVKIRVPPNTKVLYWAAKKLDSNHHIVWKAYDDYSNSGVVMSDSKGIAALKLLKGSGYIVPWENKYIPPHVHYRYELNPGKFSRIETVYY